MKEDIATSKPKKHENKKANVGPKIKQITSSYISIKL